MSIKIMTWVFYEETQTHGEERLVLLALADQANDEGLTWPGVNRLALKANTNPRSIPRALHHLIRKNLVTVEPRSDNGRSLTNLYRIVWNDQIRAEEQKALRLGVSPYKDPASTGEGDSTTPSWEGDTVTPPGGHSDTPRVSYCQGEGDTVTPESLINPHLILNEPGEGTPPTERHQQVWRTIYQQLEMQCDRSFFLWKVRPLSLVAVTSGEYIVTTPDDPAVMSSRLKLTIDRILVGLEGPGAQVSFRGVQP